MPLRQLQNAGEALEYLYNAGMDSLD